MKVIVGVVCVALTVGGCGTSSSAPKAGGTSSSAPTTNGEENRSASQVLLDAKSALLNASSVRVRGQLSSGTDKQIFDLRFQGVNTSGSITVHGNPISIVKVAQETYLRAGLAFWASLAPPVVAQKLQNRWLIVDPKTAASVNRLTLQGFAMGFDNSDAPITPKATTGIVDGKRAVIDTLQSGSKVAVANTGPPRPLQITQPKSTDMLVFSDYGAAGQIVAPPGAVTPEAAARS